MTLWELQAKIDGDGDFCIYRDCYGTWRARLWCNHYDGKDLVTITGRGKTAKEATIDYISRIRGKYISGPTGKQNSTSCGVVVPVDLCYEEPKTYKEEDIPKYWAEEDILKGLSASDEREYLLKLAIIYFAKYIKNDIELCNLIRQGIGDKTICGKRS